VLNPHPVALCRRGTPPRGRHRRGHRRGSVRRAARAGRAPDVQDRIPTIIRGVDPRSGQEFVDGSPRSIRLVQCRQGMDAWAPCRRPSATSGRRRRKSTNRCTAYPVEQGLPDRLGWSGQWRGGCGSHYVKEVRCRRRVHVRRGSEIPQPGIAGVALGAEQAHPAVRLSGRLRGEAHADWEPLEAGDKINFDYGGGGGWGDPLDRPPWRCWTTCWTSMSASRRPPDYGVVLVGSLEELTLGSMRRRRRLAGRRCVVPAGGLPGRPSGRYRFLNV